MRIILALAAFLLFGAATQAADQPTDKSSYRYAHNESEYVVPLPEPPTVTTLWAEDGNVPYLSSPPAEGAVGEVATWRRADPETEDMFEVKITFLKADAAFLAALTEEKMKATVEADFADTRLIEKKISFSTGADPRLRRATLTGFSVDRNNRPFYNAEHYLTGLQSLVVIHVRYSVENEIFAGYYRRLAEGLTYEPL